MTGWGCFGACAKGDNDGSSGLVLTPVDQPAPPAKSGPSASAVPAPATNGREDDYKPTSSTTEPKAPEASAGNTHQGSTNTDSFAKPAPSHSASADNDLAVASNSRSGQERDTAHEFGPDEEEDEDEARDVVAPNPGMKFTFTSNLVYFLEIVLPLCSSCCMHIGKTILHAGFGLPHSLKLLHGHTLSKQNITLTRPQDLVSDIKEMCFIGNGSFAAVFRGKSW